MGGGGGCGRGLSEIECPPLLWLFHKVRTHPLFGRGGLVGSRRGSQVLYFYEFLRRVSLVRLRRIDLVGCIRNLEFWNEFGDVGELGNWATEIMDAFGLWLLRNRLNFLRTYLLLSFFEDIPALRVWCLNEVSQYDPCLALGKIKSIHSFKIAFGVATLHGRILGC